MKEVGDGRLRWAAERASGSMREIAWELEQVSETLPTRDKSRRLQLDLAADRLRTAADLLTHEINAESSATVRLVARVGRAALLAGAATVGALAAGAGQGLGQSAYEDLLAKTDRAVACVAEIEALSDEFELQADRPDDESVERALQRSRDTLRRVAMDSSQRGSVEFDEYISAIDQGLTPNRPIEERVTHVYQQATWLTDLANGISDDDETSAEAQTLFETGQREREVLLRLRNRLVEGTGGTDSAS